VFPAIQTLPFTNASALTLTELPSIHCTDRTEPSDASTIVAVALSNPAKLFGKQGVGRFWKPAGAGAGAWESIARSKSLLKYPLTYKLPDESNATVLPEQ